jgi:hypothetical protein
MVKSILKGGKTKLKAQKGGCQEGFVCTDNTVSLIIFSFILIIAGMFIYFKYYDKPVVQQIIVQQTPTQQSQKIQEKMGGNHGGVVVEEVSQMQYLVNKEQERLVNPLLPPERTYVLTNGGGLPLIPSQNIINMPSRGFSGGFQQIGLLYKKDPSGDGNNDGNILPLFGRPTNTNRDKWYYYTSSDKFHSLKIPIKVKGRICNDEWGCNELYDDDTVEVGPYNGQFKVQIYGYDSPKYLPQVW